MSVLVVFAFQDDGGAAEGMLTIEAGNTPELASFSPEMEGETKAEEER